MAYTPQSIGITFGEGVDLKTDKKLTTKLTRLENGRFSKLGAIEKRPGFNALPDGDATGSTTGFYAPRSVLAKGSEIIGCDGFTAYSKAGDRWRNVGNLTSCYMSAETMPRAPVDGVINAQAHLNGVTCYVTCATGGVVYASLYHEATNAWLSVNQNLGTAVQGASGPTSLNFVVRAVAFEEKIHVLWLAAGTTIKRSYIDPTSYPLAWSSADNIITTCAQATFNVVVRNDNVCILAWPSTVTAAGDVRFQRLLTSGLTGSTTDVGFTASGLDPYVLGIFCDSLDNVWICGGESLAWYLGGVDSTLASLSSATLVAATSVSSYSLTDPIAVQKDATGANPDIVWLFHEEVYTGTTKLGDRVFRYRTNVLSTVSSSSFLGVRPRSGMMPIRNTYSNQKHNDYNGYFLATYTPQDGGVAPTPSTRRETTFLVQDNGEIAGRMFDETGNVNDKVLAGTLGCINPPAKLSDGMFTGWWFTNDSSLTTAQALHKRMLFDFTYNAQAADAGGVMLVASAAPRIYDGVNLCELGYHVRPEIYSITELVGGGSLAINSTYQVRAVYRWTDATGRQHESAPSDAISITTGAGGGGVARVQCVVSSCRLTARSGVYVDLYITAAGLSTFYYANSTATLTTTTQTTCTAISAVTTSNQVLYTTGGELGNFPPPSANAVIVRDNRAYFHAGNGAVWFSKEFITGEPPNFSPVLIKTSSESYGKVQALAEMDGAAYVLHENGIRDFVGDGPSANGVNDTFSPMRSVASDTGAKPGTQTILTDTGIVLASSRGIAQIGRGRNVEFIGLPVEDVADLTPASAGRLSRANEVIVGFKDGNAAVYNYLTGQWARWTCPNATGPGVVIDGVYYYPANNGRVLAAGNNYLDAGKFYPMVIGTSWVKPGNLLSGYQRVHAVTIVGEFKSAHKLLVDIYYDFDDTEPGETIEVASSDFVDHGKDRYELMLQPARQKCAAIKFVIQDKHVIGSEDSGFSIAGLVLEVSVLGGTNRQASGVK